MMSHAMDNSPGGGTDASIASNNKSSLDTMAHLASGISRKAVPTPTQQQVLLSLCNGFTKFREAVRWKYYFRVQNPNTNPNPNTNTETNSSVISNQTITDTNFGDISGIEDNESYEHEGLGSGLKLPSINAPLASHEIESALFSISRDIISNIKKEIPHNFNTKSVDYKIQEILGNLKNVKNEDKILLATDKTSRFVPFTIDEYDTLMVNQLSKNAIEVSRNTISESIQTLETFLDVNNDKFSVKELKFIRSSLKHKQIAEPFGIYKDHKPVPDLRLIVPSTSNFTVNFKKVLTKSLQNVFDNNDVEFTRVINNSYELKASLEKMNLHQKYNSIMSLDVSNMYPSIGPNLIKDSIAWYASKFNFSDSDLRLVEFILEGFQVCRNMNYMRYGTNFYLYTGADPNQPGLSMGDIESAYLADLCINFIYNYLADLGIFDYFCFASSYRDDGLLIGKLPWSEKEILDWKKLIFDPAVTEISKGSLKFTMEIYDLDEGLNFLDLKLKFNPFDEENTLNAKNGHSSATLNAKNEQFDVALKAKNIADAARYAIDVGCANPMDNNELKAVDPIFRKIYEDKIIRFKEKYTSDLAVQTLSLHKSNLVGKIKSNLNFSIYKKPLSRISYLDSTSLHHPRTIKGIWPSVVRRLVRLTSFREDRKTFSLERDFPEHAKALLDAKLIRPNSLKMPRKLEDFNSSSNEKKQWDNRKIPFVMHYSKPWLLRPVHVIIKEALKRHNLAGFIRFSMVYKRYTNLAELIKRDMRAKINRKIEDLNFPNLGCNCTGGRCKLVDQNCRKSGVIYQIACNVNSSCEKKYVGSTQRFAKVRVGEHLSNIKDVLKGEKQLKEQKNRERAREGLDENFDSTGKISLDAFTRHILNEHDRGWLDELNGELPTRDFIRNFTTSEVLRQTGVFLLGSESCTICAGEKYLIWSTKNTMNKRSELFSRCPHVGKLMKPAIKKFCH